MTSTGRAGNGRIIVAVGAAVVALAIGGAFLVSRNDDGFVQLDPEVTGSADDPDDISAEPTGDPDLEADDSAVVEAGADAGDASCDPAGVPAPGDVAVVFSEIHYHPLGDEPGFVELLNHGSEPIDVGGWRIDGFDHCIAAGTVIDPSGLNVIVEGDTTGGLDNGGEELALVAPGGVVVDAVDYDDRNDWPARADGFGDSLHRLDAGAASGPGNWASAEPDPGTRVSNRPAMPVWDDVENTQRPGPDEPIEISASVSGVSDVRAELRYRVGFADEVVTDVGIGADGVATASIPGQAAGELVRYRLVAESADGAIGSWPRQGDGATYTGTTVRTPATDGDLPVIEWFMPDDVFQVAFDDRAQGSEVTHPIVIAVDGEIFDEARIRVKGQSSRTFPKPKWKIELAPGQRLEVDGAIDRWVDEFALHSAYNDKSAIREVLSHEFMAAAGVLVSDAFPVTVLRNGEFYGLHTYVEQPDGRWRDRVELDATAVFEVGDSSNTQLRSGDADLVGEDFDRKFQREVGDSDDELRAFLRGLGEVRDPTVEAVERRAWLMTEVDVPGVVNALAASAVIQHEDQRTKNYRLALVDDRWTVLPFDLDFTWGRRYDEGNCDALCDEVLVAPPSDPFIASDSELFAAFVDDPVLFEMIRTRIAVLRDLLLDPDRVADRVDELISDIGDAADLDRERWGTHGAEQTIPAAAEELIEAFVVPQFERLTSDGAPGDVDSVVVGDARDVSVIIGAGTREGEGDDVIVITNNGSTIADLSGEVMDAGDPLPGGLVLPPGWSATISEGSLDTWTPPDP